MVVAIYIQMLKDVLVIEYILMVVVFLLKMGLLKDYLISIQFKILL
jgi:hypothetical protein